MGWMFWCSNSGRGNTFYLLQDSPPGGEGGGWSPHSGIFPGGKSAEAWSWPLTCTYYQGYEWVELYLYSVCMRPWRGKVQLYLTVFTCLTVEDVNEYSWNISKANAGVPLSMMLHIDDCAWRLAAAVHTFMCSVLNSINACSYLWYTQSASSIWRCMYRASSYNMYINQQDAHNSCD